jgi:hypothetical protein
MWTCWAFFEPRIFNYHNTYFSYTLYIVHTSHLHQSSIVKIFMTHSSTTTMLGFLGRLHNKKKKLRRKIYEVWVKNENFFYYYIFSSEGLDLVWTIDESSLRFTFCWSQSDFLWLLWNGKKSRLKWHPKKSIFFVNKSIY